MGEGIAEPVEDSPWPDLQAVVFDFDGTLAHTRIDFARMREEVVGLVRGLGVWDAALGEQRYVLELVEAAAARIASDAERAASFRASALRAIEEIEMASCGQAGLFEGVSEALALLRERGLSIGIISRNCRRAVEMVARRCGLRYDALLTRDDVARVKPDPGHLLACLDRLAAAPETALLVGDHPTDMQCGRAAGAATCGVLTDSSDAVTLLAAGADRVLADVPAVAAAICAGSSSRGGRGV